MYKVIVKGSTEPEPMSFEEIKEGDTFFVGGFKHICGEDAHLSGDASYEGYLLHDTNDNGWFPEDLDLF